MRRLLTLLPLLGLACAGGREAGAPPAPQRQRAVRGPVAADSVFERGPMIGHTTDTSAWIWFQAAAPVELDAAAVLADSEAAAMVGGGAVEAELDAQTGASALLRLEGLRPDTRYKVRLEADDRPVELAPGSAFRTLTRPGGPRRHRCPRG